MPVFRSALVGIILLLLTPGAWALAGSAGKFYTVSAGDEFTWSTPGDWAVTITSGPSGADVNSTDLGPSVVGGHPHFDPGHVSTSLAQMKVGESRSLHVINGSVRVLMTDAAFDITVPKNGTWDQTASGTLGPGECQAYDIPMGTVHEPARVVATGDGIAFSHLDSQLRPVAAHTGALNTTVPNPLAEIGIFIFACAPDNATASLPYTVHFTTPDPYAPLPTPATAAQKSVPGLASTSAFVGLGLVAIVLRRRG